MFLDNDKRRCSLCCQCPSYSPNFVVQHGYRLYGHVITWLYAEKEVLCRLKCNMDKRCLTFNFEERTRICELNDADHKKDLRKAQGFVYVDIKKSTKKYEVTSTSPSQTTSGLETDASASTTPPTSTSTTPTTSNIQISSPDASASTTPPTSTSTTPTTSNIQTSSPDASSSTTPPTSTSTTQTTKTETSASTTQTTKTETSASTTHTANPVVSSSITPPTSTSTITTTNWSGSSSFLAGHSCKGIKGDSRGESRRDGEYWIDPGNTGKPFTVYCDMTTDGGILTGPESF
ncbi:hypothetical protein AC249_AIPGENE10600 [Exaiptasia diaphana]|nr:hypothetical protein AC249_AIPGENE10600 [Exaiptasia diaphana]